MSFVGVFVSDDDRWREKTKFWSRVTWSDVEPSMYSENKVIQSRDRTYQQNIIILSCIQHVTCRWAFPKHTYDSLGINKNTLELTFDKHVRKYFNNHDTTPERPLDDEIYLHFT